MRPPRHLPFILYEGVANIRGWAVAAVVIGAIAAGIGGATAWSSAHTADDSLAAIAHLELRGRHTVRVVPAGSVPAAACDRIQSVQSVSAAFAIVRTTTARTTLGATLTVQFATPGIANFLGLPTSQAGRVDAVFAGATAAARYGLVTGGTLRFASGAPAGLAGKTVTTFQLPQSPRTSTLDDSILVLVPPSGAVDSCIVDIAPEAKTTLGRGLAAMFPHPDAVGVLPYNAAIETVDEPDRRLHAVPADVVTLGGAGLLVVLTLGWWFARRGEWALYRVLGIAAGRLTAIAAIEWLIVIAVPMMIGGAAGLVAAGADTARLALELGALNLAIGVLAASVAIGLWTAYVASVSVFRTLRGL
jgi:hypothetical protein